MDRDAVARTVGVLDLTSLTGEEDDAAIAALCAKAVTPAGPVAAVCLHGAWAARASAELAGTGIPVAAVANFPEGDPDPERARRESAAAVADGAREVDVVLPHRAWLAGDEAAALAVVAAARAEAPVLKVILETGALGEPATIGAAARASLAAGADFVKTSTGKGPPGASPEAARAMLEAVREHGAGGFKASGGVRTAAQAAGYVALAGELLGPGWVAPETFRIGASGLLDELLAVLG